MEKLFKSLSDAQATLFHLFQKTWIYHWDVVGPDFYQLHTVFGEQYTTMFEEIDTLTEHMRYLGMRPVSTLTRVVEVSNIDEAANANQMVDADGMLKQLLSDNKKIIEMMTQVSEEADAQKQYATSNLVQTIMETHGKFVWMLRSFTEKTPKKVSEDFQIEESEVVAEVVEEEVFEEIVEEQIEK